MFKMCFVIKLIDIPPHYVLCAYLFAMCFQQGHSSSLFAVSTVGSVRGSETLLCYRIHSGVSSFSLNLKSLKSKTLKIAFLPTLPEIHLSSELGSVVRFLLCPTW